MLARHEIERLAASPDSNVLRDVIDRIENGYRDVAEGVIREHSRIYLRYPEDGSRRAPGLFSMSAVLPNSGYMGSRLLALGGGHYSEGLLVLFEYGSNKCLSIQDDSTLHMFRSGAPQALSTRLLARPDSKVVGVLGSSAMAIGGLTMVKAAMPLVNRAKVYSPTPANRERFARNMTDRLGMEVTAVESPDEAVAGTDIIVTATDADRPVVSDAAIPDGVHINLMARNEIELATFKRSKVVSASNKALRELDPPLHEPIPWDWIHAELSDIVTGTAPGRTSDKEITVFIGVTPLAMWDVAAAAAFYEAAKRLGYGTDVELAT